MNKTLATILALSVALTAPLAAMAQGGPQPYPQQHQDNPHQDNPHQGSPHRSGQRHDDRGHDRRPVVTIDHSRQEQVRQWQQHHRGWHQPVPQSVSRTVVVNSRLVKGHYRRPPHDLVDILPRPPAGYAYFAVGGDVVLAAIATGIIAQIVLSGH
ncbi:RcnB family protein [Zavarzinia compransoris]|uniref:RcnB family protein n=1 Tax=Zavarzinia marina TaxID=2911065 RepID=UPI001F39B0EC|nr:RcnB family protein [Zavarzinia marina]MCF4165835.1 RcnB family protein [Zavarzinia marina]